jgi:hypothetical protein
LWPADKKLTHIAEGQQEQTKYAYVSADGVSPSGRLMSILDFEATVTEGYANPNGVTEDYRLVRSYSKFSTSPFAEQAYTAQDAHVGYYHVQVNNGTGGGYVKYILQNVPEARQAET